MYYVVRLRSGNIKITTSEPENHTEYFEFENLPPGTGVLHLNKQNQLYFETVAEKVSEEEAPSETAFISGLMEGYGI